MVAAASAGCMVSSIGFVSYARAPQMSLCWYFVGIVWYMSHFYIMYIWPKIEFIAPSNKGNQLIELFRAQNSLYSMIDSRCGLELQKVISFNKCHWYLDVL